MSEGRLAPTRRPEWRPAITLTLSTSAPAKEATSSHEPLPTRACDVLAVSVDYQPVGCGKWSMCPNEMVPLQIDLAIGGGRCLVGLIG